MNDTLHPTAKLPEENEYEVPTMVQLSTPNTDPERMKNIL